jgi:hypothetical protein
LIRQLGPKASKGTRQESTQNPQKKLMVGLNDDAGKRRLQCCIDPSREILVPERRKAECPEIQAIRLRVGLVRSRNRESSTFDTRLSNFLTFSLLTSVPFLLSPHYLPYNPIYVLSYLLPFIPSPPSPSTLVAAPTTTS